VQIVCAQLHLRIVTQRATMQRMQMPSPTERALDRMYAIGDELAPRGVIRAKMFGAPSLKAGTKVLCSIWGDDLVVKLPSDTLEPALSLAGVERFEPMAGRAMKEWAQVPFEHQARWAGLVEAALVYVGEA